MKGNIFTHLTGGLTVVMAMDEMNMVFDMEDTNIDRLPYVQLMSEIRVPRGDDVYYESQCL